MSPSPADPIVAIIDIGSNSIKILIARRGGDGSVQPLKTRTIDARISAGISRSEPRLSPEGMARGLDAVKSLLGDAVELGAQKIALVATSAVRDARNGGDFRALIERATGHRVRILSGDEEANLIGRGLTCDPSLLGLRNFYVFDLGGGSLECLAFRDRKIEQAVSLQLGCVRLSERFLADMNAPFPPAARDAIIAHTRELLVQSDFRFSLPSDAVAIATGGTATTVRAIRAVQAGANFEQTSTAIAVDEVRQLLERLGALPLEQRKLVPGLPPARADVFPTALATFLALAEAGGVNEFRNSVYNLRFGLADEILP